MSTKPNTELSQNRKAREPKAKNFNEKVISLSPDEYAFLINENIELKNKTVDLQDVLNAKTNMVFSPRLRKTIYNKVCNFVLMVQANQTPESVVSKIDRATEDIVGFVTKFAGLQEKSDISDDLLS